MTLTFDLLTWISKGIIHSSRTIYLPSVKLLVQSVLELSVAQGKGIPTYRPTDMGKAIICPSFFEGGDAPDITITTVNCPNRTNTQHSNNYELENWHSQRGPRCRACHYDLDLWPFDPKIYRCLPFFILHLCMKYEVCRSNTVRVIALQRSVDRRTDRQTDGQTDKVITIGLSHLLWWGPNNAAKSIQRLQWRTVTQIMWVGQIWP